MTCCIQTLRKLRGEGGDPAVNMEDSTLADPAGNERKNFFSLGRLQCAVLAFPKWAGQAIRIRMQVQDGQADGTHLPAGVWIVGFPSDRHDPACL